ncbi:MAG: DMT family transporter [Paracoccus sp. (in: a-proteobacteria)]|nr:DMT family transporter [Paracoccus sp. (in: a-proteobacteria)]
MGASNLRGAMLALVAMGIYATHDVVIKALGETYPAFQILFFAQLLSFPLVALMLLQSRDGGSLRPAQPGWVAARSACIVASGVCGFYAFSTLPLAQVYAILFATPLMVTVLSVPLLGEKVGPHRWLAVMVGLAGVLIVLRPGQAPLEAGHLAALGGAIAGALASVLTRRLGSGEKPVVLLLWPMLGNFALTGAALSFDYVPMALSDLALAGVIAVLGLVAGFLVILSYREGEAAVVAPMQYSQILWATAYGWFLFEERLDGPTILGATVIIASGLYIVYRETRHGKTPQPALRSETAIAPRGSLLRRLRR